MLLPRADDEGEALVKASDGALLSSPCQVGCPNLPSIGVVDYGHLFQPFDPTMLFPTDVSSGKAPGFGQKRGKLTFSQSSSQAVMLCHLAPEVLASPLCA